MSAKCIAINLAIVATALPDWTRFACGQWSIARSQHSILHRILRRNATTQWGKRHAFSSIKSYQAFAQLPLTEYSDYEMSIASIRGGETSVLTAQRIIKLLPTSGTVQGNKLIPITPSFIKEARRALNVWLCNMFLRCPAVATGQHYWAMSPHTAYVDNDGGEVPIGFIDDAAYFSMIQRLLLPHLFAIPYYLQSITNPAAHEYLILLFLLKNPQVSFIFVWSPTFLMAKLEQVAQHYDQLLHDIRTGTIDQTVALSPEQRKGVSRLMRADPKRADDLKHIDPKNRSTWQKMWPRLKMISCWADGSSEDFCSELAHLFPAVTIEQKGLAATESVITIPWYQGLLKPAAYRSHFYEFREIESGTVFPLWEIVPCKRYAVVVTTSGGLYRYQLHDIVEVTGYIGRIPCLQFVGRENAVVDLVGEKVTEESIHIFLRSTAKKGCQKWLFSMVAPTRIQNALAYTLFVDGNSNETIEANALCNQFDDHLSHNYHYRHARAMGQLDKPRLFLIAPGTGLQSYLAQEESRGKRKGDIKRRFLDSRMDWDTVFSGRFASVKDRL